MARKDEPSQSSDSGNQPNNEEQAGGEDRMENFTTNLNQLARVGGIDPLIGREKSWSAPFRYCVVGVK